MPPSTWNPWIGAVVIVVGVLSAALFSLLKIDAAILPAAIVTAGIALLQAREHAETRKDLGTTRTELVTLKASMRPPSLVDEGEKVRRG